MIHIEALTYISDRLADNVVLIEEVLAEIRKAPSPVSRYLRQHCNSAEKMERFLGSYRYFMVDNGRVAAYDMHLDAGRSKAVDYFKEKLISYDEPPNYMNFRGHVGQADGNIFDFINCFYPEEEFRNFLEEHPDVFIVFDDDTVDLMDTTIRSLDGASIDYFKDCLNTYGGGFYFTNLRGLVSKAPDHVKHFIDRSYSGKKFLQFLEKNSEVFDVQNGYVYLTPDS